MSSWRTHTKVTKIHKSVPFSKTNVILLWNTPCHLQQSKQFYPYNSEAHASQQQHTGSSVKPVSRGHRGNNTPLTETLTQTSLYQCTSRRCSARGLVTDLQESRAHDFIIVSPRPGSNWHSPRESWFFSNQVSITHKLLIIDGNPCPHDPLSARTKSGLNLCRSCARC